MSVKRICVVDDYDGMYGRFWGNLGSVVRKSQEFLKDPTSFDLVCFTGGEDVSPELYGHENLASGNSIRRDEIERLYFQAALDNEIPMTGICRGAQFLNVMAGGTMVQHLKANHGGGRHLCVTKDGQTFHVTSSHHQMIVPKPEVGQVLAWANVALRVEDMVYAGDKADLNLLLNESGRVRVTEAIHYPDFKIFGVQHHPEWQDIREEGPQWTLQKIRELCFGEVLAGSAADS